jgi:hypothetical protein
VSVDNMMRRIGRPCCFVVGYSHRAILVPASQDEYVKFGASKEKGPAPLGTGPSGISF